MSDHNPPVLQDALIAMRAHADSALDALDSGHANTAKDQREAMAAWALVVLAEAAWVRSEQEPSA